MAKQEPKSLFRRLSALFRSGPVVKRKIRGLDTTLAVADKAKSSGTLLFQKSLSPTYATITSNAYNLSERMMRYQDFQEMEYTPELAAALDIYADETCLSKDSIIPLLDGSRPTILQLYEQNCEDFWLYSFDTTSKKIVPGQATRVIKTGTKQIFRINLDDGTSLRLTGNHRVLLSDGTYVRVDQLPIGASLRSLYTKLSDSSAGDRIHGYEQVLESSKWNYTHRIVAENTQFDGKGVVHHVDFNKRNNNPDNLRFMSMKDHKEFHQKHNALRWKLIPGFAEKMSGIFSVSAKQSHLKPGFTKKLLERRDEVFSGYDDETRKNLFGRSESQNGMYQNGSIISGNKNGRWNSKFIRNVTRDQILNWINSGRSAQSVCEELPIRFDDLQRSMHNVGIVEWSQKSVINVEKIITSFSTWRNQQPAYVNLCRKFSHARNFAKVSTHQSYLALNSAGYSSWTDFLNRTNHRVVSIVSEQEEEVFDLEVKNWHNFATTATVDSSSFVFVHNCAQDEKGRILHVYSENEKIKEILEDLFYNVLNVEFNLRSWTRNLCKYGDFFLYNDVSPTYGVVNAFPIPVNEIEREENYDHDDPFAVRYRWVTLGNRTLENWEVTHFRLLGNDMFLPYGSSIIEPARRIWRQLILIEDAMLVYRVVRAPERRVFYIDVANVPPENVPSYIEEQRKNLRTNQVVDNATGRVDLRYNPLSVDEDYFIPVRGGDSGTRIETLAGGNNTAAVEDVAYIQKKLFAALKIPRAYLGYDEMLSSKATLAQEDIRFSRTIAVIQKTIIAELNKLAIIHLYANGFDNEDLQNFTLRLSNPSTVAQQQKLELWRAKFEIGGSLPEGMGSAEFVQQEIWGLSIEEIEKINAQRMKEKVQNAKIEAAAAGDEGGDDTGGGGDDLFGGGGGDEEAIGDAGGEDTGGEMPPEENAGEEPEEEKHDKELLTSIDDNEDDEEFSLKMSTMNDSEKPVKVQPQLKRALYNNSRHRTHGSSKTHMPDFVKMTGIDSRSMKDPTDSDFIKSMVSNPLGESTSRVRSPFSGLSPDIWSSLKHMQTKFNNDVKTTSQGFSSGVLTESDDSIELNVNNEDLPDEDEVLIIEGNDNGIEED